MIFSQDHQGPQAFWGTSSFLTEAGEPINAKNFQPEVVGIFRTVGDCILEGKVKEEKVTQLKTEKEVNQFKEILGVISCHLVKIGRTFCDISRSDQGPHHIGWSRLLCGMKRSREVYRLIQLDKHNGEPRNENEVKWSRVTEIQTMTDKRWDSVYRSLGRLRSNLRIKYEEWRIAWGRQELNRDKVSYPGGDLQSTKCSYCNTAKETEFHLYTECTRLELFWREARNWAFMTWGVTASLNQKCARLFGMEKEKPDDLLNILYRNVRYAIFRGRETRHKPSFQLLEGLMLDDLKKKICRRQAAKIQRYCRRI